MAASVAALGPASAFLVALLCLAASANAAPVNAAQQTALLAVRASLKVCDAAVLSSWVAAADCSQWAGVTCDEQGNVLRLILTTTRPHFYDTGPTINANYPITKNGTLSAKISDLQKLEYLLLNSLGLGGKIPTEIGNLKNLKFLLLDGNSFTELPSSVGKLTNLEILSCSDNFLKGSIPNEIGSLSNLKILDFSENKLSGKIPPPVVNLPSIFLLLLPNNTLNGSIPIRSSNLSPISAVYLSSNALTGTIPKWLFNTSFLYLDYNKLVGKLPKIPTGLVDLDVSSNYLSGEVVTPAKSESPKTLYFDGNYFSKVTGGDPSDEIFASDNCLSAAQAEEFGAQRSPKECESFCNARQPGGACGPYGICKAAGAKGPPTCACEKGYFAFANNQFTCAEVVFAGNAPPPPRM